MKTARLLTSERLRTDSPTAPRPYGPLPSLRQLAWHKLETYGFLHFTVNTFTDKEWGYGDESPSLFCPTDFDADQIARVAAAGGLRGLILTAKHHDGFCLWPSRFTEHSVKHSPWRGGRGDVVAEIAEACRHHDLKFGVYLSPWDRNAADYGQSSYVEYYRAQLRELLTNYGPLCEVWFDGANGGDGFYGGARETRSIDRRTYYDWPNTWQIVRALQPGACMFSDAGPDVRWVGNERGEAGETCWATLNRDDFAPGEADHGRLNRGDRPGTHWLPAECDVSIRPGWFYHAAEDDRVKTADQLVDLYFKSVGRGASFLLNLPPDRRGQIHPTDAANLAEYRDRIEAIFAHDLAHTAAEVSGPSRGAGFAPRALIDGDPATYWATADSQTTPEAILEFRASIRFNVIGLAEHLPLGQRVSGFAVDALVGGAWQEITRGVSIGSRRLIRTADVETPRVRLRVTDAAACPAVSGLGLWYEAPGPAGG